MSSFVPPTRQRLRGACDHLGKKATIHVRCHFRTNRGDLNLALDPVKLAGSHASGHSVALDHNPKHIILVPSC
jgi:hypothetical protein